jgi:hypothetical protein
MASGVLAYFDPQWPSLNLAVAFDSKIIQRAFTTNDCQPKTHSAFFWHSYFNLGTGEMMIRRFCALTILASSLVFATGAFSLPTRSEMREVAKSAGAAAAGFALCDSRSKANEIKRKFRDVAQACTSTSSASNDALNAFDLEYSNTLNAGGSCRGNNQARFDTVIDTLDRAEEGC